MPYKKFMIIFCAIHPQKKKKKGGRSAGERGEEEELYGGGLKSSNPCSQASVISNTIKYNKFQYTEKLNTGYRVKTHQCKTKLKLYSE